jgi:RNA polymerase sigma-70 factor, ECF subfamily
MSPDPQRPPAPVRTTNSDEAALVQRALAGDRDAFGALVHRYQAQVRRVTRAVLGDPDEADDAAQDAFLSALSKLAQFDPRRPFGPWLMRIASNAAIDRRRRQSVRRAEPIDEAMVDGRDRTDRAAERRRLSEHLRAALAELPERQRLAVTLYDAEGYSHAEIAAILGVPEGTVRSDVFHARRRLRVLLDAWKESLS